MQIERLSHVDEKYQKVKSHFLLMHAWHTEQTERAEGVHKANGTNGNPAEVCILYQTRVFLQKETVIFLSKFAVSFYFHV